MNAHGATSLSVIDLLIEELLRKIKGNLID